MIRRALHAIAVRLGDWATDADVYGHHRMSEPLWVCADRVCGLAGHDFDHECCQFCFRPRPPE